MTCAIKTKMDQKSSPWKRVRPRKKIILLHSNNRGGILSDIWCSRDNSQPMFGNYYVISELSKNKGINEGNPGRAPYVPRGVGEVERAKKTMK